MRVVLQRCLSASVSVDSIVVSSIGKGILVLAAIGPNDNPKTVEAMAGKILKMKLWPNDAGAQWKLNVREMDAEVLCVSQFTLFASTRKGNKPDFHGAAKPDIAKELYHYFVSTISSSYQADRVKDGVFQAMMQVSLINDGPVTLQIDTEDSKKSLGSATPTTTTDTAVFTEDSNTRC